MLPYPGPAGPSFPAGTTTSVSSRARARDRARDRPVGERGERLGDADDRDARRVEHVAVGVGVDRQLEAGQQLVGSAVDGESAFGARLPAGDADRQDRRARRDAPDTSRTAAADEQARDLRAVTLESHRLVRVRARNGASVGIEHVDSVEQPVADERVRHVDAGVEQGDRHASTVESGQPEVGPPAAAGCIGRREELGARE